MKRLLLVIGPILSISGASGLVVFGSAIVGVLDGVMTYRIVNPPAPPPTSLVDLGWAAISGMALTIGLAISCGATVMRDSRNSVSLGGTILSVVAGVLLLVGAIPLLRGVMCAIRDFRTIAASATTPNPENVREMVQGASSTLTVGCAILFVGSVVLFVAGQIGVRTKPLPTSDTRSMFGVLVAIGSTVLGVVVSLLFVGIWLHGDTLLAFFADVVSSTPRPSNLAQHLSGVLNKSLVAFMGIGCQGVVQIAATISAPSSSSETVSESLT